MYIQRVGHHLDEKLVNGGGGGGLSTCWAEGEGGGYTKLREVHCVYGIRPNQRRAGHDIRTNRHDPDLMSDSLRSTSISTECCLEFATRSRLSNVSSSG